MATLQIPFSRWDWPSSESSTDQNVIDCNIHKESNHPNHLNPHNKNNNRDTKPNNHRSDVLNCSHPKTNPLANSLSSLSAMLLEGQAVLAHQTASAIWLFIGLSNGSIWKWSINLVITNSFFSFFNSFHRRLLQQDQVTYKPNSS